MIIRGFEIESGVEMPLSECQIMTAKMLDVARAMKVGDSVLVPSNVNPEYLKGAMKMEKQCYESRKEGTTGTRIWRTA